MDTVPLPVICYRSNTLWATVDTADFEQHELWRYTWALRGKNYVARMSNGHTIYLHRVIMGCSKGDGMEVDHIDHDPFNNTRANLRVVTGAENRSNRRPYTRRV